MNPNNCETCEYKRLKSPDQDDDGHCYMFRDEPREVCMQHTGRKKMMMVGKPSVLGMAAMLSYLLSPATIGPAALEDEDDADEKGLGREK